MTRRAKAIAMYNHTRGIYEQQAIYFDDLEPATLYAWRVRFERWAGMEVYKAFFDGGEKEIGGEIGDEETETGIETETDIETESKRDT